METPAGLAVHPDHAVVWHDHNLYLLDQRVLPAESRFVVCHTAADTARAITDMVVRGAPAIGVTAAYGVVLAARERYRTDPHDWRAGLEQDIELLAASRPTAVNLFWALRRMRAFLADLDQLDPVPALLAEARRIHMEDAAANRTMGDLGAALINTETDVITHCNAGALATGGYGTALGVIRSAHAAGKIRRVYADETRPWLQGSRLTAWELQQSGIPVTVQADNAAASLMAQGKVGWVIVGSDRIAANGDVCNKIGTYALAVLARHHGVRFMVAAPTSTIDMQVEKGAQIPIEERDTDEVLACGGARVGPEGVQARNPVFDVTPAALVDYIVTERGVIERPDAAKLQQLMHGR
ncbi:S-methyl-5-thioribose-1-phosphate isomerase [Thiohalocapsa marina]|uniref:Methylthioribose-1-phosphate isomerase n=1 Tax=Thiohalocapsa marina TaxID=424902 RepID=A0A5M8FFJ0_9GAMM|nr:S-methyl-5-thioribose-1-phosphate isomerase [Thiohalocapsa marina]KAA6182680.1 S-methyl-5-thioribose-1-phosphate isomerase [Thiohalocapsa marina]